MKIGNPANPKVTEIVEFTVDSSAAYSIVPAAVLKRLGVRPFKDEDFVLADGTTGRRKVGAAFVQQDDRIGCANVIFGEVDDRAMLGTLTLPMIWGRKRRAP